MSVLDIQNLNVSYVSRRGVARAVRDLSLTIHEGETYGLVGESGCGKSTVALSIMRYMPRGAQVTGSILFQGQDLMQTAPEDLRHLRGNRIAMVYQDPQASLNPVLTIERQLAEAIQAHEDVSDQEASRRATAMLERVRMPDPAYTLKRYPHQLSGGMQQRVVIAMALLMHPDLVVMDEPTTGLDVTVEAGVLDLLNDLRREFKMAILYISHNLGVVARICDRVGVMYAGELVEQATKDDLFRQPHHPYTVGLLRCLPQKGTRYTQGTLYSIPGRVPPLTALPQGCIFASRCALVEPACLAAPPPLESAAPDHVVRCIRWQTVIEQPTLAAQTDPAPPRIISQDADLLEVRGLKIYFKQAMGFLRGSRAIKAVDSVNFGVQQQHTLAIVGESGCGKSTIARGLAGLTQVTAGEVDFNGSDFTKPLERRSQDALREMQMIFQNPDSSLNPRHTIRQTLSRPLRLFKIVPPEKEEETMIALLREVNLDESYLDRLPKHLSGGEKQRVAIARAFAGGPQMVVCDEPISALDVSVQAAVLNLLQRLQSERQVALVFISHDLNAVRYLSDTVAVIYLGRIAEIGPTEAIFSPPYHPYTEALVSAIPEVDPDAQITPIRLSGVVPSPANPPSGCRFHTRCPRKIGAICETEEPPARNAGDGHTIYCHIPLEELTVMQTGAMNPSAIGDQIMLAYVDIEGRWNIEKPVWGEQHHTEALQRAQNIADATGLPCQLVNYWDFSIDWMKQNGVEGFCISGNTPDWVEYDWDTFKPLQAAFMSGDYPVLGFCGGHQLIGMTFGAPCDALGPLQPGDVDPMPSWRPGMRKEKAWLPLQLCQPKHTLFKGFPASGPVVMESHYWEVKEVPERFDLLASTDWCQVQVMQHQEIPLYSIQGHPEAYTAQYPDGKRLIHNWALATGLIKE